MEQIDFPESSFERGYHDSRRAFAPELAGTMAAGSRNVAVAGDGSGRPLRNPTPTVNPSANVGIRSIRQLGFDWGGLKDYAGGIGVGSVLSDIGKSLWFIGNGHLTLQSYPLPGAFASSILQVLLPINGNYLHPASGPYQAGLPQPSAPDIGIAANVGGGYLGEVSGAVSVKIARLRLRTGARSRASTTSAVVVPARRTVRVTFPLPSVGQDNWAAFFTQQGFGGVGLHYRLAYQGSLDIPESVVAASSVDGIPRSLEFDYKDEDLVPQEAWIDDFAPPSGTHCVRLENVMIVLGCYADAVAGGTPNNPGTAGAVSLPNYYESYKPRHLVYFPGPVVDALARESDSYAYVATRNSIHALQYVGERGDLPAVTVTTILPDMGIETAHNWTHFRGRLAVYVSAGSLLLMDENGNLSDIAGASIRNFIKDWQPRDTVIGFDPSTQSIVLMNKDVSIQYSLEAKAWSAPCYQADQYVFDKHEVRHFVSAATVNGRLLVNLHFPQTTGHQVTCIWENLSNGHIQTCQITPVQSAGSIAAAKNVYGMSLAVDAHGHILSQQPIVIAARRNSRPIFARRVAMNANNAVVTVPNAFWTTTDIGQKVCVIGPHAWGPGRWHKVGKIAQVLDSQSFVFGDLASGALLDSTQTFTDGFVLLGDQIKEIYYQRRGQQTFDVFFNLPECRAYQFAAWQITNAGEIIAIAPRGTVRKGGRGHTR